MFAALSIQLGLKTSHRVYARNPSFERGHNGPWEPHPWFPAVERREIFVTLESCLHFYWQYRRRVPSHNSCVTRGDMYCDHIHVCGVDREYVVPFDWLREYGPYWEPGTKAFWLDPDTDAELAAWMAKYRAPRQKDYLQLPPLRQTYRQVPHPLQNAAAYQNQLQNQNYLGNALGSLL